jgi:hypothetical protein
MEATNQEAACRLGMPSLEKVAAKWEQERKKGHGLNP